MTPNLPVTSNGDDTSCSKCGGTLSLQDLGELWFEDVYGFARLCVDCYMEYLEEEHGGTPR